MSHTHTLTVGRGWFCAATIAACAIAAGCVGHQPRAAGYTGPEPLPAAVAARYEYPAAVAMRETALREENRHYAVRDVVLQVDGDADQEDIRLEYYDLAGSARTPVILVLPILNGRNFFARQFAGYFAKRGYAAVIVHTSQKDTLLEDMEVPERAIRGSVIRHRQVLDWAARQEEFDHERIGVFGASLGGLNAILLAALDERIAAVAPALAGGDLPTIFVESEERRVAGAVDAVMVRKGFSREQMHDYLQQEIQTDPIALARHADATNVLMILARRDRTIPFATQEALRREMGYPEAVYLPTGHVSSAIYLPYLKRRVYRFFEERFASD